MVRGFRAEGLFLFQELSEFRAWGLQGVQPLESSAGFRTNWVLELQEFEGLGTSESSQTSALFLENSSL